MERPMTMIETETPIEFLELGTLAEGTIEAREEQRERLEEFTERVASGEFHAETALRIPAGCIDGRCGCSLKPNTAGGSESLMVADDLTTQQFAATNKTTVGAYDNVIRFVRGLHNESYVVGGHDDGNRGDDKTGCGANDRLPEIYAMITKKADDIRKLTEAIGVKVDDETHTLIQRRANERTDYSASTELLQTLETAIGDEVVDHLLGVHNEVIAVINRRNGTTLDRDAVELAFSDLYEAFNIDVWSFPEAASVISTTNDSTEQQQKIAAMAYYNLATALVLCGPAMRVVVLD